MNDELADFIYAVNNLCEIVKERDEFFDDEEIKEALKEVEETLDAWRGSQIDDDPINIDLV